MTRPAVQLYADEVLVWPGTFVPCWRHSFGH